MPNLDCKLCGRTLCGPPLIACPGMPKSAQYLPVREALDSDPAVRLEIYQCESCGLVQLGGGPVPYFREVIRAAGFSVEMREFRLRQFKTFVERFSLQQKNVLEIGCGGGEYLALMHETGVRAFGLEYSESQVARARKAGLAVIQGFMEGPDYRVEQAPFSAFLMLNFLEHLPEPHRTLRGIHNNLADHGAGLIEVPNFNMVLQKKMFAEFTTDHLLYFTPDTFTTLLSLNGFEVLSCSEVWHGYILSAVVRKKTRLDVSGFQEELLRQKNEVLAFVERYRDNGVAIWGAGHQALTAICLLELKDKIRYVVDSADFKQNKFTPASHIPIYSPQRLSSDPVAAVLVMAASYSDEVVRTIRRDHGDRFTVGILTEHGLKKV